MLLWRVQASRARRAARSLGIIDESIVLSI